VICVRTSFFGLIYRKKTQGTAEEMISSCAPRVAVNDVLDLDDADTSESTCWVGSHLLYWLTVTGMYPLPTSISFHDDPPAPFHVTCILARSKRIYIYIYIYKLCKFRKKKIIIWEKFWVTWNLYKLTQLYMDILAILTIEKNIYN
jgi:hypothetical protein